jgi:hypothetical protein
MKTTAIFTAELQNCTFLDQFVLTSAEWSEFESGTPAYRVKTFNDSGKLVGREYVLRNMDNTDEVLEDMQAVAGGYYTDTCAVTRK